MHRLLAAAGAAACAFVAIAVPAQAEQLPAGLYGSLSAGALFPQDVDGSISGTSVTAEYDTGFTIDGAVGYRFGNGLRIEGELGYGRTSVDKVKGGGISFDVSGADIDIYTFTANAFYDFDLGSRLRPYIGAGVGIVHSELSSGTVSAGGLSATSPSDDSTGVTAFGEAGVSYAFAPRWEIVPSYRFQWYSANHYDLDDDMAHIVKIGLRYSF